MVNDKDYDKKSYHAGFQDGYAEAKEMFKRPQGEWLPKEIEIFAGNLMVTFTCNHCNHSYSCMFNFCPNCGADMRGSKNESGN